MILNELKYDWGYPKRKQTFGIEYHPSLEIHKIKSEIQLQQPINFEFDTYQNIPAPFSLLIIASYLLINPLKRRR